MPIDGAFYIPGYRKSLAIDKDKYRKTFSRTLVDNNIVGHSDVVGAPPVGAANNYILIIHSTPSFNGLGKDNSKTRRETFKVWDLVRFILEVLR